MKRTSEPRDTKPRLYLHIAVTKDLKSRLKAAAAKDSRTLTNKVARILTDYVNQQEEGR